MQVHDEADARQPLSSHRHTSDRMTSRDAIYDTGAKSMELLSTEEELQVLGGLSEISIWESPDVLQSDLQNPASVIPLSKYDHCFESDSEDSNSSPKSKDVETDRKFEGIGNWPRRLLYVPTMESFEWQPGDIYGGRTAPSYNAVSYTWGRYGLDRRGVRKKKVHRNVKAIKIDGISWAVPRVDPKHFTADQLQKLIQKACTTGSDLENPIEFLWLDVACIDQKDPRQKMAEIGRQAVIFSGAQQVFVWLTKLHDDSLERIMTTLVSCSGMSFGLILCVSIKCILFLISFM